MRCFLVSLIATRLAATQALAAQAAAPPQAAPAVDPTHKAAVAESMPTNAEPPPEWVKQFGGTHDKRMKWWREARFGMFIHWGVYAIPGGVWKGAEVKRSGAEWIMNRGKIPVADYQKLPAQFNPVKFDAKAGWRSPSRRA
jgi:hypothetical protein